MLRERAEFDQHLVVAPARRVLLEEDGQDQGLALRLDAEAGVEVDREWHSLPLQGGFGDRAQELHRPDRQVEPERAEELRAPKAGAGHDPLGRHLRRPRDEPAAALPAQPAHRPLLTDLGAGCPRRPKERGHAVRRRDAAVAGRPAPAEQPVRV